MSASCCRRHQWEVHDLTLSPTTPLLSEQRRQDDHQHQPKDERVSSFLVGVTRKEINNSRRLSWTNCKRHTHTLSCSFKNKQPRTGLSCSTKFILVPALHLQAAVKVNCTAVALAVISFLPAARSNSIPPSTSYGLRSIPSVNHNNKMNLN